MLSISFYGGSDIGLENRSSLYIQNALVLCYFGLLASSDQLVSELNTEKSVIHESLKNHPAQLSLPISNFLKTSVALKIQASIMPATVKVPPTMAQTVVRKW